MVAQVTTFAFHGVEARPVTVQVQLVGGQPAFAVVGLPDKAVSEARERVRAALSAVGLGLPPKRITVNLAPADLLKEGSHYDLAIALGVLIEMGAAPHDAGAGFAVMGELGLDGSIAPVAGALPAAVSANAMGLGLICPAASGAEAAWAGGEAEIIAPKSLIQLVNHFKGTQVLSAPAPGALEAAAAAPDLIDVKGQETAKRALEIAAAGGHNLLMVGPPGAGKSMLAARLPGLLPSLSPAEMLEISMIQSLAGLLEDGRLTRARPFRAPHHSASMAAMIGGGVATTAGGVRLLRVYALYLHAHREFERLVHPSSVGRASGTGRRIRRQGAYIAWIFFMLFALTLTAVTALLAAAGLDFEAALILALAGLSSTGPLVASAAEDPIRLIELGAFGKLVFSGAMVLGRVETLALVALVNPAAWRE